MWSCSIPPYFLSMATILSSWKLYHLTLSYQLQAPKQPQCCAVCVCVCPKRHGEWIHFTGMRSWVWDVLHQNTYCMFLINSCLFSLILKNNWVLLTFINSVLFGSHKVKSCVLKTAIVSATVTNRVFTFISVLWIGFMNIHEIRETEFHVSFTLSTTFGAGHLTANIQSIRLPFEVNDHKAKE